jgi:HEAT repeat protein
MARGADLADRAVAVGALVALAEMRVEVGLADQDPSVRRAAAIASLAQGEREVAPLLKARLGSETDAITREVLATGLVDGDPDARLTTLALLDRARAGGVDAPLAAMALAQRGDPTQAEHVAALLASRDPLLRSHAALGLGASSERDASGRLADAYAYEPNPSVRRAIVLALARRTGDAHVPERAATLRLASRLDPDRGVRLTATRALADLTGLPASPRLSDVAWLRVATSEGAASPSVMTGALLRSDGLAVPIVFDSDGYALAPVPPGEVRLLLAPRPPTYKASAP